ncbi:AAA family ATPase [Mucilaginibacter sp. OK098]|uniref:AAA family ATPase n=1 Tax=Mucilaginibacter sp. OK098 TaxID=1855297 RepID=UPI000912C418|nr:AAA family ATPase [Mucilaginibacter sp. OK098]SHM99574.1 AAA domain-containing protein [Mucilaginibacter sp. OK098]
MPSNPLSERPPIIEQLRAESRGLPLRPAKRSRQEPSRPSPEDCRRMFTIENGNRWLELARREPEAKMLFGELWHQGELCMLFADTNIGKSVLAVQLGESIARGQSIAPFTCQAPPARVLYIDFELSQSQFGLRYTKDKEDHQFSDNFFRAQYNFIPDPPPNVNENELLIAAIEYKVKQAKATVLIIDNITCLRGGTENSAVALALMKSLKALKNDHNLSILVLAHTPKRRNATQPISADDLHGSKLLINFADSAFAIGKSTLDNDLCYLKQIKQRNTRQRYGHDNVCLCRIQKPGAFLYFKFEDYSAERHHLLSRSTADRRQLADKIATLSAADLSQRNIARQLGISPATVNRLIRCADVQMRECADEEGCADMQMHGCADGEECANNLMTNDVMPNDQNADALMTNNQNGSAPMTNDIMTNDQHADSPMTNDVMTNDQKASQHVKFNPEYDRKTSTIDKLLTPELLDQILQTTTHEKASAQIPPLPPGYHDPTSAKQP